MIGIRKLLHQPRKRRMDRPHPEHPPIRHLQRRRRIRRAGSQLRPLPPRHESENRLFCELSGGRFQAKSISVQRSACSPYNVLPRT